MRKLLLLSALLLAGQSRAATRLCYQIPDAPFPPFLIVSVDPEAEPAVMKHNKAVRSGKLKVMEEEGPGVLFVRRPLVHGDCLLLDPREMTKMLVSHEGGGVKPPGFFKKFARGFKSLFGGDTEYEKTNLYPAVGIAAITGERFFGWLDGSRLEELFPTPAVPELGVSGLLAYGQDALDLTLIYVLCERSRERLCTLKIRDRGDWVLDPDTGEPFTMMVLARSRRETRKTDETYRIHPGGDTPQGVYPLWASMYSTKKVFGGLPRIDLDAQKLPVNAPGSTRFLEALKQIVPEEHWDDYWLNEWPLAFRSGRVLLRIHGNSVDPETPSTFMPEGSLRLYRPTSGCVNTGDDQQLFLDTMVVLEVFDEDKVQVPERPKTHYWEPARSLGKVFLVVKDID